VKCHVDVINTSLASSGFNVSLAICVTLFYVLWHSQKSGMWRCN